MTVENTPPVTVDIDQALATIALSRASVSNALDVATKEALIAAIRQVGSDNEVRAALLTAAGRNFCVGQDLGEHVEALRTDPLSAMDTVGAHYNPILQAVSELSVPVVVAIRGACVGAGLGLALAGDIRVAGEGAKFATAFTGIGLASDSGLSHTLVHALGASRASGLMLLGDRFDAADALAWGLVHRVVADAEVDTVARDLALQLAQGPTQAYRHVKQLLRATSPGLTEALERERLAQERLGASSDHSSAVESFLAKSRPVFTGH
ncbi:enoyl-CoA hydratase/isomerase family protein [Prescottella equi]|uniref:Enoyl-CoA hydratase/isomerase family protein n=2 Tax=Rhodococcus hoagii TaxID=43767 RepID=E9SXB7_RHOHA|nr:enoyl-CoA hydratase-related protein [Prescottella equi]MBU4614896.1 enoyl-CoA hydratase/isomerase family protein [Rhodococcus sp. GG48]EGD25554.1 enoyl-CoA hydratase/isomerase family protein [Prescottella equi ATCC 33707]MBM4479484.1 enoyl-CoA hydratase [Prescottella equi]MBM4490091.1 enoyl-CoA hydratase [Prescottella equi]MBM4501164.1 enoyl-CoA hydratase [Prescottella equi]